MTVRYYFIDGLERDKKAADFLINTYGEYDGKAAKFYKRIMGYSGNEHFLKADQKTGYIMDKCKISSTTSTKSAKDYQSDFNKIFNELKNAHDNELSVIHSRAIDANQRAQEYFNKLKNYSDVIRNPQDLFVPPGFGSWSSKDHHYNKDLAANQGDESAAVDLFMEWIKHYKDTNNKNYPSDEEIRNWLHENLGDDKNGFIASYLASQLKEAGYDFSDSESMKRYLMEVLGFPPTYVAGLSSSQLKQLLAGTVVSRLMASERLGRPEQQGGKGLNSLDAFQNSFYSGFNGGAGVSVNIVGRPTAVCTWSESSVDDKSMPTDIARVSTQTVNENISSFLEDCTNKGGSVTYKVGQSESYQFVQSINNDIQTDNTTTSNQTDVEKAHEIAKYSELLRLKQAGEDVQKKYSEYHQAMTSLVLAFGGPAGSAIETLMSANVPNTTDEAISLLKKAGIVNIPSDVSSIQGYAMSLYNKIQDVANKDKAYKQSIAAYKDVEAIVGVDATQGSTLIDSNGKIVK